MRRALTVVVVVLVTGLALAYALWDVDFAELSALLAGGDYWVVAPFLVAVGVFFWLKAVRWALILAPLGTFSSVQVTPAILIGFAGNNVLPGRLGELVRIVVFARQFDRPISGVLVSLALERLLDAAAILALLAGAMLGIESVPGELAAAAKLVAVGTLAVFTAMVLIIVRAELALLLWDGLSAWMPRRLARRIRGVLETAIAALGSMKSPRLLAALFLLSTVKWALACAMAWLSLWAYGVAVPAEVAVVVLAVTSLAVVVPSAPGFIGVIQAGFVFALVPFGVSEEVAFAASVFFLVGQWVPVTLGGAVCFFWFGLRTAELRREVDATQRVQASGEPP